MKTFSNLINESNKIEVTRNVVLTLSNGSKIECKITVDDISEEFATQTILDELRDQTIVHVDIQDEDINGGGNNSDMFVDEDEEDVVSMCSFIIDKHCLDELIVCDKYAIVNFLKDEDCVDSAFINATGDICIDTESRYAEYLETELSRFCDNEVEFKLIRK
jgi:hypothetical protein